MLLPLLGLLSLLATALADLHSDLTGKGFTVSFPGDSQYSSLSQSYNKRYVFKPAAIALPKTPQHVSTIIKASVANNFQVVARSGGHSYIANGLGGKNNSVVVDLRNLNSISVNPSNGNAVVGSGNRLGDIALALNKQGRAMPHGTCPYALRGAAGSFGITTSITFKTHAAPASASIIGYTWDLTAADAADALGRFQTFVNSNIPKEFGPELSLNRGSAQGRVQFHLGGGWYGPANGLDAVLRPFLSQMPKPKNSGINSGTYIHSVASLTGGLPLNTASGSDRRDTFYAKSLTIPQDSAIGDASRKAFMKYLSNEGFKASTEWFVQLELYGGSNSAISAVGADATAYAHRNSLFTIQFYSFSPNPPYPASGFIFVDGIVSSIVNNGPSGWDVGAYPNYVDDRLQNYQHMYFGPNYARLQKLKATYDARGLFTFPTGVQGNGR